MEHFNLDGAALRQIAGRNAEDWVVRVYCHSYPYAVCHADIVDSESLLLHCDMAQLPRHVFVEVEFELFIDDEFQLVRLPVYLDPASSHDKRSLVRFSFKPETTILMALEQMTDHRVVSCTG
jgi:hypothetical protein